MDVTGSPRSCAQCAENTVRTLGNIIASAESHDNSAVSLSVIHLEFYGRLPEAQPWRFRGTS